MQKKRRLVLKVGLVQLPKNANKKYKSVPLLCSYQDTHGHFPQLMAPCGHRWRSSVQTGILLNSLRNHSGKTAVPATCQSKCSFGLAEATSSERRETNRQREEGLHIPPAQSTHARCQPHSCLSKITSITKIKIPHAEKGKKLKNAKLFHKQISNSKDMKVEMLLELEKKS